MKKFKIFAVLLMLIPSVALFAACGGNKPNSKPEGYAKNDLEQVLTDLNQGNYSVNMTITNSNTIANLNMKIQDNCATIIATVEEFGEQAYIECAITFEQDKIFQYMRQSKESQLTKTELTNLSNPESKIMLEFIKENAAALGGSPIMPVATLVDRSIWEMLVFDEKRQIYIYQEYGEDGSITTQAVTINEDSITLTFISETQGDMTVLIEKIGTTVIELPTDFVEA